jgi:hypothetical protein
MVLRNNWSEACVELEVMRTEGPNHFVKRVEPTTTSLVIDFKLSSNINFSTSTSVEVRILRRDVRRMMEPEQMVVGDETFRKEFFSWNTVQWQSKNVCKKRARYSVGRQHYGYTRRAR